MNQIKNIEIAKSVNLNTYFTDKFKTSIFSVFIHTPLKRETATINRLLLKLISGYSKKFSSAKEIERKKADLYGLSLSESCLKDGDIQILSMNLDFISNKFTIDDENLSASVCDFLMELLLNPKFDENGYFFEEDINREKRLLRDELESILNDKRKYALKKGVSLLFDGEAYGLSANGYVEDLEKITREDLKRAYEDLIYNSAIEFIYVGEENQNIEKKLKYAFEKIERVPEISAQSNFFGKKITFVSGEEHFDLTQSKVVMGFRADTVFDEFNSREYVVLSLMNSIFGGGTYSKLFMNVREKQSLCYYCSSQLIVNRFALIVQSGVEDENIELAEKSILREFQDLSEGKISDDELKFSKIAFENMLKAFYDTPELIESLIIMQIKNKNFDLNDLINLSKEITKDDIKRAAEKFTYSMKYAIRPQSRK
ncbi:MAG: pitrilysin family protein [Clostridia bacterium]|nr:pitrilysin family protein [Clostridia bacterium]